MENLTSTQLTTLRTWLLANASAMNEHEAAAALNANKSPDYIVWKTLVSIADIGDGFNASELAGLSSLNNTRLQTLAQYSPGGINPSLANRRQFFDDVFSGSGGVNTRASLAILWKRKATVGESLLATGAGTTASPSTLAANGEGEVTPQNVIDALR